MTEQKPLRNIKDILFDASYMTAQDYEVRRWFFGYLNNSQKRGVCDDIDYYALSDWCEKSQSMGDKVKRKRH